MARLPQHRLDQHHAGCRQHVRLAGDEIGRQHRVGAGTDDDGTHQHGACDICNGPAMAASASALLVLTAMHPQHASRVERFASSELLQGVKPPIS